MFHRFFAPQAVGVLTAGPVKIVDGSGPLRTTRRGSAWPRVLAMKLLTSELLTELMWLFTLSSRGREGKRETVLKF